MARLRSELTALAIPVALCLAAWIVIVSRPAARARHVPSPRERVTLQRHPQRPPTPTPPLTSQLTETPHNETEETAESAAQSMSGTPGVLGSEVFVSELIEITGEGSSSDWWSDDWADSSYRWERWLYYARRDWARWRADRLARLSRRVRTTLMPGDAGDYDAEPSSPVCAVFASACRGASARRSVTATPAATTELAPATIRREGARWTLSNRNLEASVDPSALCAIALSRRVGADLDTLPPLSVATPSRAECTVSATMIPDAAPERGGVAVAITWQGDGWSQRAVLSLMDDAASPELSVARSERVGSRVTTTLTNLTASPLTWTLSGHDVAVPSAHSATFAG